MLKKSACLLLISLSVFGLNAQPVGKYTTYNLHSNATGQHYELFESLPTSYRQNDNKIQLRHCEHAGMQAQ